MDGILWRQMGQVSTALQEEPQSRYTLRTRLCRFLGINKLGIMREVTAPLGAWVQKNLDYELDGTYSPRRLELAILVGASVEASSRQLLRNDHQRSLVTLVAQFREIISAWLASRLLAVRCQPILCQRNHGSSTENRRRKD